MTIEVTINPNNHVFKDTSINDKPFNSAIYIVNVMNNCLVNKDKVKKKENKYIYRLYDDNQFISKKCLTVFLSKIIITPI